MKLKKKIIREITYNVNLSKKDIDIIYAGLKKMYEDDYHEYPPYFGRDDLNLLITQLECSFD